MSPRLFFSKKLPYFKRGSSGEMDFRPESKINTSVLLYGFIFFIFLASLVIVLRLFQLTVVKGGYYARLAEENRIREILIEPKRGKIIDRKGFTIAENKSADPDKSGDRLISSRIYYEPEAMAHLVGYRQLADQSELDNDSCLNSLKLGDKIGKKGVEKIFDCQLRGKPGKKLIEVDVQGKYLRTLSIQKPVDGETVQLAIDLDLQKKTYDLIKNKKAAVVALKPQTGEVLIYVSSPSFDPTNFEEGEDKIIESYLNDKDKPLFSRVTEGTYPPGSIFKLVIATGALEEKTITSNTQFEDTGTIKAGSLTFGNWYFLQYGKTDGMVDIVKAIRRSNDIFFYYAGKGLGVEKTKKWADLLGFGQATTIGFEEAEGLVPSAFWKKETLKDNWYTGDTYNLSIGQGYLLTTPLQIVQATAVFANEGYLCKPKLLRIKNKELRIKDCQKLPILNKTLDTIKQGMVEACAPGGTGWPLFEFKVQNQELRIKNNEATGPAQLQLISTACKTGTAESRSEKTNPHAWFTVYAPVENPEIVLTVLIEEGGQGSDVAGPIARDILKAYFERSE